jgi:hypothetical protein
VNYEEFLEANDGMLDFLLLAQENESDRGYMDRGRSSTHSTCRPYAPAASAV